MDKTKWIIAFVFGIFIFTLISYPSASGSYSQRAVIDDASRVRDFIPEPPPWRDLFPYLLLAKTALAATNAILLTILFLIYIKIYRTTKSQFSIGLIIFTVALLLYSLTSNPLIHGLAGFRLSGLGPFTMLPDLFTCIASAILLYLSQQ